MNKLMFKYFLLVASMLIIACSGKKETVAEDDEWPMMDQFHMIMAESFHPYKDSANIAPAIANADEMAALAVEWTNSTLPGKVNKESVKADLELLRTETASFAELVKSGSEEEIGESLRDLHDLFHRLQDAWYHGEDEHKHNH